MILAAEWQGSEDEPFTIISRMQEGKWFLSVLHRINTFYFGVFHRYNFNVEFLFNSHLYFGLPQTALTSKCMQSIQMHARHIRYAHVHM